MPSEKFDWRAADVALRDALAEVFKAQRHRNHRKRANVLRDIAEAEHALARAYEALELPKALAAVDPHVSDTGKLTTRAKSSSSEVR